MPDFSTLLLLLGLICFSMGLCAFRLRKRWRIWLLLIGFAALVICIFLEFDDFQSGFRDGYEATDQ